MTARTQERTESLLLLVVCVALIPIAAILCLVPCADIHWRDVKFVIGILWDDVTDGRI